MDAIINMYTTLNNIKNAGGDVYCPRGWNAILNYVGKTEPDDDPITFYTLVDAVGILGAIWCLRTIDGHEDKKQAFLECCSQEATQEIITTKFLELFGG